MTPVQVVIQTFGGIRKTARAIGRSPASVWEWQRNGVIPAHARLAILAISNGRGLQLTSYILDFGIPVSDSDGLEAKT